MFGNEQSREFKNYRYLLRDIPYFFNIVSNISITSTYVKERRDAGRFCLNLRFKNLWNWRLTSACDIVYIFQSGTILWNFGEGLKEKFHELFLASCEPVNKIV